MSDSPSQRTSPVTAALLQKLPRGTTLIGAPRAAQHMPRERKAFAFRPYVPGGWQFGMRSHFSRARWLSPPTAGRA